MRTTLDIDDDVLAAAKQLGAREKKTAGKILSEFFRRALHVPAPAKSKTGTAPYRMKNGIPVLPSRGEVVTVEKIRRLTEEENL